MTSKRTILLIDDSDYIIEGTASLLRFEGYAVVTANNGRDGLQLAKEHLPDLIICDVSMPEMDGYTVLRHLREDPLTAGLRFMFLTARAEKSDMRTGMDIGADDYLIKPFTIEELLSAIEAQWKKSDVQQRNVEEITRNVTYALPHEFRTPLNQILGAAQTLKSVALNCPDAAELADDIRSSAQRLLRISENFLVYAQLETLAVDRPALEQLRKHRTDEVGAVAADIAMMKGQAHQRGSDVGIGTMVEGISVAMSGENFHKMLDELLDNAFKFSQPGTPVQLDCAVEENYIQFQIHDRGCGMTSAQIVSIGAYKQFDRVVREQQGVGLGLAIAKRLVELHGGEFRIESSPGKGTTVIVRLPRC
ncbi:MAG: response regulator [Chlorobi bacterium]|nr:response regulator [Chlorobiota bacterium]